jgi:hypothetical protein
MHILEGLKKLIFNRKTSCVYPFSCRMYAAKGTRELSVSFVAECLKNQFISCHVLLTSLWFYSICAAQPAAFSQISQRAC